MWGECGVCVGECGVSVGCVWGECGVGVGCVWGVCGVWVWCVCGVCGGCVVGTIKWHVRVCPGTNCEVYLIMGAMSLWTRPRPCTCVQGLKKIPKAHHRENELRDQAALSGPSAPVAEKQQAREPNLSMNCNCGASTVSAHQRHTNSLVQNCASEISMNFGTVWTNTGTCRHKNNGRVNNLQELHRRGIDHRINAQLGKLYGHKDHGESASAPRQGNRRPTKNRNCGTSTVFRHCPTPSTCC